MLNTETYNLFNRCSAPLLPRMGHFFRVQSRKKHSTLVVIFLHFMATFLLTTKTRKLENTK